VRVNGNGCGHDPDSPRWFAPPEKHAKRPGILTKLSECVRRYYRAPADTLPGLNAANGSSRQQRSERREACLALLGGLIHYLDLVTLRVGIPQPDGSFAGLKMDYLADVSGLGERRAERAIADLAAAGLITIHPIVKRLDDCTYKGFAAIRAVSRSLFDVFGLGKWLRHERDKASARRRKTERKANGKDAANVGMLIGRTAKSQHAAENVAAAGEVRSGQPQSVIDLLAEIKAKLRAPP
jgi:hypothetical protein